MVIFGCFLAAFLCVVNPCFAEPSLQVESDEIDWGTIYAGEKREHHFVLHNEGDSQLEIIEVRSSCGCTAALVSNKAIFPGEQAELYVRFNSKFFSGKVTKRVEVISNDLQQPQKQFILRASILRELKVTPAHLSLEAIEVGEDIVCSLILENNSSHPLQIKSFRSTSRYIKFGEVPEVLEPNEKAAVSLTVHLPQLSSAVLSGYILIDARGITVNQLRIPVTAKIVSK